MKFGRSTDVSGLRRLILKQIDRLVEEGTPSDELRYVSSYNDIGHYCDREDIVWWCRKGGKEIETAKAREGGHSFHLGYHDLEIQFAGRFDSGLVSVVDWDYTRTHRPKLPSWLVNALRAEFGRDVIIVSFDWNGNRIDIY